MKVKGKPKILYFLIAICVISFAFNLFLMAKFPAQNKYEDTYAEGDNTFDFTEGEGWTVGFGKQKTTPEDYADKVYFIAGYYSNNPVKGVLDDTYARAMWLDDNTGRGAVVIVSIDCVGMSRKDIMDIRLRLSDLTASANIKSINVMMTHAHSAVDTQGLWGEKFNKSGRNEEYMNFLKDSAAQSVRDAYANRQNGALYSGWIETEGMQDDVRTPVVYDPNLYRIRFVPDDIEKKEIMLINYACHAELLGKNTDKISADWPAYMGKYIEENSNSEFIYVNGAIGGMISSKDIMKVYDEEGFDCETFMKDFGREIGEYVLNIDNEVEIKPIINIKTSRIFIPVDNKLLIVARFLNVMNNDVARKSGTVAGYTLPTELSYLVLGNNSVRMFLVPGELYPELQLGGFLDADNSATGKEADYTVLNDLSEGEGVTFVIGLANDAIGYIIPDNDFLLHDVLPYMNWAKDKFGREHYEETNSTGINTARIILEEFKKLVEST